MAAVALGTVLAGCSRGEVEAQVVSYRIAAGTRTYLFSMKMDGTAGFGPGVAAAAATAGVAPETFTADFPLQVDLGATVSQGVEAEGDARRVTLRVDDVSGSAQVLGQSVTIDKGTLEQTAGGGALEFGYRMQPDGTTDSLQGIPLGSEFTMGAAGGIGSGCPKLPAGGVEPGQTWTGDQPIPIPGVQGAIHASNTYDLDADTATIRSTVDGPFSAVVDVEEFARRFPQFDASSIAAGGVSATVSGTVQLSAECVIDLRGWELQRSSQSGHLAAALGFSGTSGSPELAKVGDGEFLHVDADLQAGFERR